MTLALLIVLFGAVALAQASPNSVDIQPESGSLSGDARIGFDPQAAGGSHVEFIDGSTGGSGCGLAGEVFCENFENGPYSNGSRNGDFDINKFSVGRLAAETYPTKLNVIEPAKLDQACRSGVSLTPLPPNDTLTCDPTSSINTAHGFTAVEAQNYGDNSVRINQPFDFAGRTGTIRFDTSLNGLPGLEGGTSINIAGTPLAVPSLASGNGNGSAMESGIMLISVKCNNNAFDNARLGVFLYEDHTETEIFHNGGSSVACSADNVVTTSAIHLNRVELRLSNTSLEIWASDYSDDGVTFPALKKIYTSPSFSLPFTQGWISFGGHNHATKKYNDKTNDSINTYWDNIAFDGPFVARPDIYQVADANIPNSGGLRLGYQFTNKDTALMDPLPIDNVDLSGATSSEVVFNVFASYEQGSELSSKPIDFRINGGQWRRLTVTPELIADASSRTNNIDQLSPNKRYNYRENVPLSDLAQGSNTIEFAGEGFPGSALGVSHVANIDLLVYR